MKALSIRPDYAIDILAGNKKIEYRSWNTDYRGDLLICSTAKKIKGTIPGHALIVCQIADVKKLAEKKFAWKLITRATKMMMPLKLRGVFSMNKLEFITLTVAIVSMFLSLVSVLS